MAHPVLYPGQGYSLLTTYGRTNGCESFLHPSDYSQTPIHPRLDAASPVPRTERSSRPPITSEWKTFHQTLLGYDHMVWKFIYLRKSFLIRPTADDHARSAPGTLRAYTGGRHSNPSPIQPSASSETATTPSSVHNVNCIWTRRTTRRL